MRANKDAPKLMARAANGSPLIWVRVHMAGKEAKSRNLDLPSLRTPTGFPSKVVEKGAEHTNQTLEERGSWRQTVKHHL